MAIHRLEAVPGQEKATAVQVDGMRARGAYELSRPYLRRNTYRIVDIDGDTPRQVDEREAQRFAYALLAETDEEAMIAHDELMSTPPLPDRAVPWRERQEQIQADAQRTRDTDDEYMSWLNTSLASDTSDRDDRAAEVPEWSARAQLMRDKMDWEVVTENVYVDRTTRPALEGVHDFPLVPMARAFTRVDTREVLSVQGLSAMPVNNRDALSLMDPSAEAGRIKYIRTEHDWRRVKGSWKPALQKVALSFELQNGSDHGGWNRWNAGGLLSTSHDGTTAIHCSARVVVAGVPIYAPSRYATKHTRYVQLRLRRSDTILGHVIDNCQRLMEQADAVQSIDLDKKGIRAGLALALADALFPMKEVDEHDKDAVAKEQKKRDRILSNLRTQATKLLRKHKELGGLAYVLAAGHVGTRTTHHSFWTWTSRRERITKALVEATRFEAKERALAKFKTTEGGE